MWGSFGDWIRWKVLGAFELPGMQFSTQKSFHAVQGDREREGEMDRGKEREGESEWAKIKLYNQKLLKFELNFTVFLKIEFCWSSKSFETEI